jgi:chemotaxis protein CheX
MSADAPMSRPMTTPNDARVGPPRDVSREPGRETGPEPDHDPDHNPDRATPSGAAHRLTDDDVKVFVDAVTRFFRQSSNEPATVRAAFLGQTQALPPASDYTGLIRLSGAWQGAVYFSAPAALLRQLLQAMNERGSHDGYLDAVGEIANTIAGNARRHFGERLQISVPETTAGPLAALRLPGRPRPLVIAVDWRGLGALVVVDL